MARPNDPVSQAESFETLRRKLLRQNRDLARVNSTQSLKIRQLENECARMLSENLELRGQILQLEKELEDSKSQRIADHALEIKAKLEAQLVEWGSLLATLGGEPPAKRLDQRGRRTTQPRPSLNRRSPPQKSLRDVARDIEARAKEEGRLTPILEHKTYPRRTMDRNEIMAICSEAEVGDNSISPDLGPPPMSRFVAEDPAPTDSPSKAAPSLARVGEPEARKPPPPAMQPDRAPAKKETAAATPAPVVLKQPPPKMSVAQRAPMKVLKSGSKRKYDDSENAPPRTAESTTASKSGPKPIISVERMGGKTLKELASERREAREKLSAPAVTRKPLAAKSTNEDVSSPKKVPAKKPLLDENAPTKPVAAQENVPSRQKRKDANSTAKAVPFEEAPVVAPESTCVEIHPELAPGAIPSVGPPLLSPSSPEPAKSRNHGRDTPPPADINADGETSRPSRRARGQISYAEPNLRDKMRRQTKEMVGAVAGEGKFRAGKDATTAPPNSSKSTKAQPTTEPPASPLADKGLPAQDGSLSSAVSDRRRRSSMLTTADSTKTLATENEEIDTPETSISLLTTSDSSSFDVYDFPGNSPSKTLRDSEASDNNKMTTRKSRAGRRSSALHEVDLDLELPERPKSSASKKRDRASMNVLRTDDTLNEGVVGTRGKGRRNSTML